MRLKPNTIVDFKNTLENEILPLLRQRKGFRDELVLVAQNGTDAVGISLWDNKENAEAYQKEGYPDIQKRLTTLIEGTPQVQTYEVSLSTFHKVVAGAGGSRSGS
jgi:heme-degrading monooxygenase HmoA